MQRIRVGVAAAGALAAFLIAVGTARPAPRPPSTREIAVDRLPTDLSGTWEFAREERSGDELRFRPIQIPGTWQESGYRDHGVAWVRIRLRIEPGAADQPLAFASTQIRDADEAFFDGVPIGSAGAFPPAYAKATLIDRVYALPPALTTRPGTHVLAFRIYNAGPRDGGITGAPRIDRLDAALADRSRRDAVRLLLAAAIGTIGLAVLVFYLRDRAQREFLFFFFFTVCFSAYQLTWLSAWRDARSDVSWQFRLNMFFIFVILAFYLVFNLRVFGRALQRRHVLYLAAIAVLSAGTLAWPRVDDLYRFLAVDEIFFLLIAVEMLWILIKDAHRRIPYAAAVLAGTLVCAAGAAHDILQDLGLLGDPAGAFRLLGPAIFVFTVVYLWVMADRFARANQAATTDVLTGLPNRKLLFERLELELARSRRSLQPCALAILDLDQFKSFNDRYGHLAGDQLLRVVASAIKGSLRTTDLVARYGGEEFVLVLPGTGAAIARQCLERIRFAVAQARVSSSPETRSASIGAVVFDPAAQPSIGMMPLLRNADAALYSAKAAGRNRLVLVEGPLSESAAGFPPARAGAR